MQRALMQELDAEDDTYWNQSNLSSFTFDDEASVSARSALAEIGKSLPKTQETSPDSASENVVETVDWSGNLVNNYNANTAKNRTRPAPSTTDPSRAPRFSKPENSNSVSEIGAVKFNVSSNSLVGGASSPLANQRPSSAASFPAANRIGASLSPEPQRSIQRKGSGASSIGSGTNSGISTDDGGARLKRELTPEEFSRLGSEHSRLKLKFEHLRRDRYKSPEIRESISRLMRGDRAILELYTKREDKISLLDTAIKVGDGNVITKVVLYLHHSLSYALFQEQLIRKPDAANHYLAYLRDHQKLGDLVNALLTLGRKEEAAMVEFRQACRKCQASEKVTSLQGYLQSGNSRDPTLKAETDLAKEYCYLLERQIPIDLADDNDGRVGKNQRFKVYPKKASLVDQPVLTMLYYCCLYHYNLPENSYACPLTVKKTHNLTEKQFCWVAVKALSRQKLWTEIKTLLTTKGFYGLGSAKIKSPIPYDKLIDTLDKHGATCDILGVYVRLVNDSEERLKLAKKYRCYDVAVDCYVAAKDRLGLIDYTSKLTSHTKEAFYAQGALQNSGYKWKN